MIQAQTYLHVADNSGARKVMCIRVLVGSKRKYARIGDTIIGVVKEATPNMPLKKSDVVRAVVVRTKKSIRRESGMLLRFDDNAVVIVNKEGNPCGSKSIQPNYRCFRTFNKKVSDNFEIIREWRQDCRYRS